MRRRLLLGFLAFAAFAIAALEIPLGFSLESRSRSSALNNVQRDAASLAVVIADALDRASSVRLREITRRYALASGGGVIVVEGQKILASSGGQAREEIGDAGIAAILAAARLGPTSGISPSESNDALLYVATPLSDPGTRGHPAPVLFVASPASAMNAAIGRQWLELGAFGLGMLVLAGLAGMVLSRSLTRPLRRIETAVSLLGAGDLGARAPLDAGPGELRALGATVNSMAMQLGELLAAQRGFVAEASHQLRTPLTALRLRIENLERSGAIRGEEAAATLTEELDRLSRLVAGLLALARAEGSRPERVAVDVAAVVGDRVVAFEPLAEEQQVTLDSLVDDRVSEVLACPGHLEQILDNLLANAFDVAPKGSTVRVAVDRGSKIVAIHVIDEGPGMSVSERERAFQRFWRGEHAEPGGSGLGLAIVEQLVRVSGGTIELLGPEGVGLDALVRLEAR